LRIFENFWENVNKISVFFGAARPSINPSTFLLMGERFFSIFGKKSDCLGTQLGGSKYDKSGRERERGIWRGHKKEKPHKNIFMGCKKISHMLPNNFRPDLFLFTQKTIPHFKHSKSANVFLIQHRTSSILLLSVERRIIATLFVFFLFTNNFSCCCY
jgi:hypothetical protein